MVTTPSIFHFELTMVASQVPSVLDEKLLGGQVWDCADAGLDARCCSREAVKVQSPQETLICAIRHASWRADSL